MMQYRVQDTPMWSRASRYEIFASGVTMALSREIMAIFGGRKCFLI